jgi:hypothetical protein
MTVGDGLPVHRHMVDKTVASRQVTRHVSQRDRHAGNLSPRHTTAVDLAAAHGLADTLSHMPIALRSHVFGVSYR